MHKKFIFIILAVIFLTYGNSLFNGFVGDDEVVIVNNQFYNSWSNFPKLFSREYNTNSDNNSIFISVPQNANSGSVAYRPVLSTTFFVDRSLWGLNPFGYHLTNLILHSVNSILVYFLLYLILGNQNVAMVAALLFATHPVQAEAVCNVGFRADLVATFFVLLSFVCLLQSGGSHQAPERKLFIFSHLFYFLSVFAKESAVIAPLLFMAQEYYFLQKTREDSLKNLWEKYQGFTGITLFYLYIYFFQFPNTALNRPGPAEVLFFERIVQIFLILGEYIIALFIPNYVHVIPPLYSPLVDSFALIKSLMAFVIIILFFIFIIKAKFSQYPFAFFLFWFLLSLLPVSNIFPNPNPIAYRYIYLPSIGIFAIVALLLERLDRRLMQSAQFLKVGSVLKLGAISLLIVLTIPLTFTWRNEYVLASVLVEYYPKTPGGYLARGTVYFKYGLMDKAKDDLQKSLDLGLVDPRGFQMLGVCLADEPEKARRLFERSIEFFPNFAFSYTALGRLLLFQGDYEKALPYFQKSLELTPTYAGYGYLMQIYLMQGHKEKAGEVFKKVKREFLKPEELQSLIYILKYDEEKDRKYPVDIGV